jgi:hypothetical protein
LLYRSIKPQFRLALSASHPDKLSGCVSAVPALRERPFLPRAARGV